MIAAEVAAVWGLERDVNALLDDRALDRAPQVETHTDGTGGRQHGVNGGNIHEHPSSGRMQTMVSLVMHIPLCPVNLARQGCEGVLSATSSQRSKGAMTETLYAWRDRRSTPHTRY